MYNRKKEGTIACHTGFRLWCYFVGLSLIYKLTKLAECLYTQELDAVTYVTEQIPSLLLCSSSLLWRKERKENSIIKLLLISYIQMRNEEHIIYPCVFQFRFDLLYGTTTIWYYARNYIIYSYI